MDSITHLALGAVLGEALAGKSWGKKAMLAGALAQSIPDVDFLAAFFLSPVDNLLVHRGFTHSILFCILASIGFGFGIRGAPLTLIRRNIFFLTQTMVHILLDSLNNYGVGWFEPFAHYRISFDTIFVADPFFSIWAGIGAGALLILDGKASRRRAWITLTLLMSLAYLLYSFYNKSLIEDDFSKALPSQGVVAGRTLTTPAPFNNWLWFTLAETDSGYYIGYRSVFDRGPFRLTYFARNDRALDNIRDTHEVRQLLQFSKGFYVISHKGDTLVFNDLRFGQVEGWRDPDTEFAFHYYLGHPEANRLVVQRGRFEGWNRQTLWEYIKRCFGFRDTLESDRR